MYEYGNGTVPYLIPGSLLLPQLISQTSVHATMVYIRIPGYAPLALIPISSFLYYRMVGTYIYQGIHLV